MSVSGKHASALSDEDAGKEVKKMVAFITQEASEKAHELHIKAEEEFAVEKARLVKQETVAIEAQHQRKCKAAEVRRRVVESGAINRARLAVLSARDDELGAVFEKARKGVKAVASNGAAYQSLLSDFVLEGILKVDDQQVIVKCRLADQDLVKQAVDSSLKRYREMTQRQDLIAAVEVDTSLSTSAGGVVVEARGGKIRCDNTLDARLALAVDEMLPEIRRILFGYSANRRFFD